MVIDYSYMGSPNGPVHSNKDDTGVVLDTVIDSSGKVSLQQRLSGA